MSELKACSVCGRDDGIGGGVWEGEHCIHCLICDVEVRAETQEEAIAKWNRRPIEDKLAARIAELEAERDKHKAALSGLVGNCRPGWQEVNVSEETINAALEALKGGE